MNYGWDGFFSSLALTCCSNALSFNLNEIFMNIIFCLFVCFVCSNSAIQFLMKTKYSALSNPPHSRHLIIIQVVPLMSIQANKPISLSVCVWTPYLSKMWHKPPLGLKDKVIRILWFKVKVTVTSEKLCIAKVHEIVYLVTDYELLSE